MIVYEDDAFAKMLIQSYEYLGSAEMPASYRFKALSPFPLSQTATSAESAYGGEWRLAAEDLERLLDLPNLIDRLQRIHRNGPGRMWAPDAP
jgi:hypothetical protein